MRCIWLDGGILFIFDDFTRLGMALMVDTSMANGAWCGSWKRLSPVVADQR